MKHGNSKTKPPIAKAEADLLNERLSALLSVSEDSSLFKLTVYLDYQVMNGKYVNKIDTLAKKYFRGHSTIKNIISEVENMEKSKFKRITNKLRSLLL